MAEIKKDYYYTKNHEWISKTDEPSVVKMGITDFAQASLGDITYVELPSVGDELTAGQTLGSVESVKAVSDIYAPVNGTVVKVNEDIENNPASVNTSPYETWMVEIKLKNEKDLDGLLKPEAYQSIAV